MLQRFLCDRAALSEEHASVCRGWVRRLWDDDAFLRNHSISLQTFVRDARELASLCVERRRPSSASDLGNAQQFSALWRRCARTKDLLRIAILETCPDLVGCAQQGAEARRRRASSRQGAEMPMAQRVEDEGSVSETGETRRGLRERLAAQVDAEVATALFDVLEREVRASGKGASVGAVVFVKAAADGDVARALRRCGQSFGQAHREWMRVNILVFDEVAVSRGFWSEDGLARKTVNDLVADARSCYAPVETKCGAIKTLLLHFPWHLRDSACPTIADVQASWWLAFDELSPVTGSGRVCCASDAVISLRARVAQVYSRAPAPILPENVCASQVCAARCQALQVAAREEALGARLASPHGFRIIPLAIDFLCAECECLFSEADVDKLDNSMVLEWCRRMGCADHDPGACRFWLRSEKARHCARAGYAVRC